MTPQEIENLRGLLPGLKIEHCDRSRAIKAHQRRVEELEATIFKIEEQLAKAPPLVELPAGRLAGLESATDGKAS